MKEKKQKVDKFILTILLGSLLVLGGGFIFATKIAPKAKNQENYLGTENLTSTGTLSAEETLFDFGNISMAKGTVKHTFKIKNSAQGPVVIPKIYTSCMCTTATYLKGETRKGPFGMQGHGLSRPLYEKLEANEETEIEVTFDPAAHGPTGVGAIQREVILEQEGKEPLKLAIKALVTP